MVLRLGSDEFHQLEQWSLIIEYVQTESNRFQGELEEQVIPGDGVVADRLHEVLR